MISKSFENVRPYNHLQKIHKRGVEYLRFLPEIPFGDSVADVCRPVDGQNAAWFTASLASSRISSAYGFKKCFVQSIQHENCYKNSNQSIFHSVHPLSTIRCKSHYTSWSQTESPVSWPNIFKDVANSQSIDSNNYNNYSTLREELKWLVCSIISRSTGQRTRSWNNRETETEHFNRIVLNRLRFVSSKSLWQKRQLLK